MLHVKFKKKSLFENKNSNFLVYLSAGYPWVSSKNISKFAPAVWPPIANILHTYIHTYTHTYIHTPIHPFTYTHESGCGDKEHPFILSSFQNYRGVSSYYIDTNLVPFNNQSFKIRKPCSMYKTKRHEKLHLISINRFESNGALIDC